MTPTDTYLAESQKILAAAAAQKGTIHQAADWCETILNGKMVHVFGSGHKDTKNTSRLDY